MTITQRLKQLLVYETLKDSQKESKQDIINSDGWLWKDRIMKLITGEIQTRISNHASFMIQTNHMVADHVIDEMMTMKIWVSSWTSPVSIKVAIFDKKVATFNKKLGTFNKKGNFWRKKWQFLTKKFRWRLRFWKSCWWFDQIWQKESSSRSPSNHDRLQKMGGKIRWPMPCREER